ncbi:MAG: V-type ATP synthase subunit D [Candidatus Bathyarchaeota archaeon]|nr:V-type ATP synthase subunit D [Candidatus Bathyarchaeum tardum]WGM89704.1 MAG: V-type ATP synthase subunit D [Candidatus Bathyarchaeum tardum]WNZ30199.1 MAG: V-type ATP synthase subunit D [Candidatus Bathyarchaeota archaeon]
MSAELTNVHPTRLELLRLKHRKSMADGIVDILKKEIDALTLTLLELLKKYSPLREKMYITLNEAYNFFVESQMVSGSKKVDEASLVTQPVDYYIFEETTTGVLGLQFPVFQLEQNQIIGPRFNPLDTPASLDNSSSKINDALHDVVKLAEIMECIKTLLDVIARKKRQMNRLQFKIIPELDATIRYIELILEETERQDAIRVRVLQRKRKERSMKRA